MTTFAAFFFALLLLIVLGCIGAVIFDAARAHRRAARVQKSRERTFAAIDAWFAEDQELRRRAAEWDAWVEQARRNVTETPIHDELAIRRFRAELDAFGGDR